MIRFLLLIIAVMAFAYFLPAKPANHEASIEIDESREETWRILADLSQLPRWNESMSIMEFVGSQKFGLGAMISVASVPVKRKLRVAEWIPYNQMTFRVETDPQVTSDHTIRYSVHPRAGGCLVRYAEEYRPSGGYLGTVLDKIYLTPVGANGRDPALANLKRLVETGQGIFVP